MHYWVDVVQHLFENKPRQAKNGQKCFGAQSKATLLIRNLILSKKKKGTIEINSNNIKLKGLVIGSIVMTPKQAIYVRPSD